MIKIVLLICTSIFYISLLGQSDFSMLQPVENNKYKKVLKRAQKEGKLALFIGHSPQSKTNSTFNIADGADLSEINNNYVTAIVDWNKHTRHQLFEKASILTNPYYLVIHPDDVILHTATSIKGYEELLSFVGQGVSKNHKYENLLSLSKTGNAEAQKELALMLIANDEKVKAIDVLEDWLHDNEPLQKDEDIKFLAATHQKCLCSNRMDIAMQQYEDEMARVIGLQNYLNIRQTFILSNLKSAGLMEPFYVWENFDNSLGTHADSLYRLFAIEYFRSVLPDKQVMLDEIYNFLYYYPDTPWESQKILFNLAIISTEHEDDWLLLLDLIEYQILSEPNYSKKDYKSFILFKLGNVERAMALMSEVEGEAIQTDADYQPLLFKLVNK